MNIEIKKWRCLVYLLMLTPVITLCSCFETCPTNRKRLHLQEEFFGKIDTLYYDDSRKGQPFVLVGNYETIIINDIFDQFSKGDILFKRSGSMKYYWVRRNDTSVFYQQCGSDDITDD